MKNILFRKVSTFFKLIFYKDHRSQFIDNYTWKPYRLISSYQIKYFPLLTYKFVGKGRLPTKKNRINETENPCNDFSFKDFDEINENDKNEEINIILKGISNENKKNINKSLLTYIVNMNYNKTFYDFQNITHISSDKGTVNGWLGLNGGRYGYQKTKNKVIYLIGDTLSLDELNNKSRNDVYRQFDFKSNFQVQKQQLDKLHIAAMKHKINISQNSMGSGLWAIIYLINRYKKLNIYGWDQYRETAIQKISITGFIREIWDAIDFFQKSIRTKEGKPAPKKFFCSILISYIYTFQILTNKHFIKKITVHGHVSSINLISPIMMKLKKIIYN